MASREETKSNDIKTKEEEEMIEAANILVCLSRAVITESENIATEEVTLIEAVEDIVTVAEVVVAEEELFTAQEEVIVVVEPTVAAEGEITSEEEMTPEEEMTSEEVSTISSDDYNTYTDSDSVEDYIQLENDYSQSYIYDEEDWNREWQPDFNVEDYIDADGYEYWMDGERLTLDGVLDAVHNHTCATNYVNRITLVVEVLSCMFLVQRICFIVFLLTSK